MADPRTPEEADLLGEEPFIRATTLKDKKRVFIMERLAREYLVDFNLHRACARADLKWSDCKFAERDPFFIRLVHDLVEVVDADTIITRQEILMGLKREAAGARDSKDRIKALGELARLLGLELPQRHEIKNTGPVINLNLTQTPPQ